MSGFGFEPSRSKFTLEPPFVPNFSRHAGRDPSESMKHRKQFLHPQEQEIEQNAIQLQDSLKKKALWETGNHQGEQDRLKKMSTKK